MDMGWDHDDSGIVVVGAEHRRRRAAPGIGDAGSSEPRLSRDRRSTYRPGSAYRWNSQEDVAGPVPTIGRCVAAFAGRMRPTQSRVRGVHSPSDVETPMDMPTDRTGTGPPTTTCTDLGRSCALCGSPGSTHGALLPDATVIDPDRKGRDGRRYVTACGTEHLQVLIDRARRDWVAEQLWFGLLCRASSPPATRDLRISILGERARLSPEQLHRAVDWNARSGHPRRTLPGEQALPNDQRDAAVTDRREG